MAATWASSFGAQDVGVSEEIASIGSLEIADELELGRILRRKVAEARVLKS
jgi:hypothetical protein